MPKRIMIVDDDRDLLTLVTIMLQRAGFEAITVDEALVAVEMLETVTPDLIILDIMMPVLNGIELCKQIRARAATATVPVLMLSARADLVAVEDSLAAGANDYLPKPMMYLPLVTAVRKWLDSKPEYMQA